MKMQFSFHVLIIFILFFLWYLLLLLLDWLRLLLFSFCYYWLLDILLVRAFISDSTFLARASFNLCVIAFVHRKINTTCTNGLLTVYLLIISFVWLLVMVSNGSINIIDSSEIIFIFIIIIIILLLLSSSSNIRLLNLRLLSSWASHLLLLFINERFELI